MGLGYTCFCLVIFLMVTTAEKNSTVKHSDRRGKALKISKKPCSDPSGRKGICTFKWDCINHNGTLMGTCVDGFIFGTCCQYDHDPALHDDIQSDHFIYGDSLNAVDGQLFDTTTTQKPVTTTKLPSTRITTTKLPIVVPSSSPTPTRAPNGQLVTWTSIGPTRRPVPQRPIILSPFPFRPGVNFPPNQGSWPVGVAFPVDPFQLNRPLQAFRPTILIQSAQSGAVSQVVPNPGTTSYTILNGSDRTTTTPVAKDKIEMTTISVPIPEWSDSTAISIGQTSTSNIKPTPNSNLSRSASSPRPVPYASGNESSTRQPNSSLPSSSTTQRPRKPALDYRKDCGVRALGPRARIVGGQSAYFGRWPWQVLVKEAAWLGLYQKNKCGGVLISARYAITAGHCQPGRFLSSLMVILGEYDLLTDFERMKPEMRRVKRMIVHRNYNAQNFDNDIALLELDPPVIFRPHISPICLPDPDEDFTGKMAYVTGWGKTSHGGAIPNLLQEVQVPIMQNNKCVQMFKDAGHTKLIKDTFLCAGYQAGGKDSCEGDSGGPLMVERDSGQWVLAGTVSHGIRCADPNLPGVYMRISAYRSWIDKIIK